MRQILDFFLQLLGLYKGQVIPMIAPKFKDNSDRLKKEYDALPEKNHSLFDIVNDLAIFFQNKFNKDLIITMIYRTDEEQAEIYKDDPKYNAKPFKSPHQFMHAFDIRSLELNQNQIEICVEYLNNKYNSSNYYTVTSMYHEVANHGKHFHVQYLKK